MRIRYLFAVAVLLCLVALGGCAEEAPEVPGQPFYPTSANPFQQTPAERDSVVALLQAVDQEPFREAFARLDAKAFTRYTRVEQFDDEDFLVAYEEHVLRHLTREGERTFTVLDTDSAGTFNFGYFSSFVSENVEMQDPPDLTAHLLPEDPPYLSARNREAYVYRLLPDTLMWDHMAQVIEVRARPVEGDGQNIRLVRLYVDRDTDALIGVYMERIDLALLFREESRFYAHVRPFAPGEWVPYNTRFETIIRVPFRPAQLFRTVSTYYDYSTS